MRVAFKVMFFMLCLNLASFLVYMLGVPGTEYTQAEMGQHTTLTEYQSRFNATNLLQEWSANPFQNLPYVGHLISGATLIANAIRFLIIGFPETLDQFAGFIGSEAGRTAFGYITTVLKILFAVVTTVFVIELVRGQSVT